MKKFLLMSAAAVLAVIGIGSAKVSAPTMTANAEATTMVAPMRAANTTTTAPTVYTGTQTGAQYGFASFTYGLWAGKTISAGSVSVVNDNQNLYVTVSSPALIKEVHIYLYDSLAALPTSRPVPGLAPYSAKNVNSNQVTVTIPTASIVSGKTYYLAVHVALTAAAGETNPTILALAGQTAYAAGNTTPSFTGKGAWYFVIGYTVTPIVDEDDEFTSETAWAYGGAYAVEFGTTRWGWSNGPLASGTYAFDIYAAAGQNNLEAGTLVGTLNVSYLNGTVTVSYVLTEGFTLNDVHLYVGESFLPTGRNGNYTYAPGQFPLIAESVDSDAYTFVINNVSGSVYVAAHAVVTGDFSD